MSFSSTGAATAMGTLQRTKNSAVTAAREGVKEEKRMPVFVFGITCTWLLVFLDLRSTLLENAFCTDRVLRKGRAGTRRSTDHARDHSHPHSCDHRRTMAVLLLSYPDVAEEAYKNRVWALISTHVVFVVLSDTNLFHV